VSGGLESVQTRHADVQHDDIRAQRLGEPQHLMAVLGLADDLTVGNVLDQPADTGADKRVIVGEEHANRRHDVG
jgi:hypothetical protein